MGKIKNILTKSRIEHKNYEKQRKYYFLYILEKNNFSLKPFCPILKKDLNLHKFEFYNIAISNLHNRSWTDFFPFLKEYLINLFIKIYIYTFIHFTYY